MRVLISALGFVPGRSLGGETYFRGLLQGLNEAGRSRDVSVAIGNDAVRWMEQMAPYAATVAVRTFPSAALRHAAERMHLAGLIRRTGAGLVFFPFNTMTPASCSTVAMIHDMVDRFYRVHGIGQWWHTRRYVRELAVRRTIQNADRVVVPSQAVAGEVTALRPPSKGPVVVIPEAALGGQHPAGYRENRENPDGGSYVFLQPGCYAPHKNSQLVIRALAELRDTAPGIFGKVSVVFSGVSTMRTSLAKLAVRLGVQDKVTILGRLNEEEFERLYSRADAIVLPSLYEGFGLPVVEARLRGIPVLASDIPVFREVSGGSALFFDAYSPRHLAAQIVRLMDGGEAPREGRAGASPTGKARTWLRYAEELWEVFEECALARGSAPARHGVLAEKQVEPGA